jgi:flagellar hook-associated protein FlgK
MGFGGLSVATSGLRVAQRNLNITGHNIANAEVAGFSRQRIVQTTAFERTVGVNVAGNRMTVGMGADWSEVHQIRNEFLDINFRNNVSQLQFYSTKVQAGLMIETLLGELHGAYNFQTVLNNMWFAIQELTAHPEGLATRQFFLSNANSLLTKAQEVFAGLVDYQFNLDAQIREVVNGTGQGGQILGINATVAAIGQLNHRISFAESAGERANDYRDERNRLLDHLASLVPIDVFYGPKGEVNIMSLGHHLLSGRTQSLMGLRYISNEASFVEVVFTNAANILPASTPPTEFTSYLNYLTPINAAAGNDRGRLLALLQARGTAPANHMSADVAPPVNFLGLINAIAGAPAAQAALTAATTPEETAAAQTAFLAQVHSLETLSGLPSSRFPARLTSARNALAAAQAADDAPAVTAAEAAIAAIIAEASAALPSLLVQAQNVMDEASARDPNNFISRLAAAIAADNTAEELDIMREMERDFLAQTHNHRAAMWSINNAMIPQVQMNLDRIVNRVATMINDALMGYLRGEDGNFVFYVTNADGSPYIPDPSDIDPVTNAPRRVPVRPRDLEGNCGGPLFIRYTEEEHTRGSDGNFLFYYTNPDGSPRIATDASGNPIIDPITGDPARIPRRPWPISDLENPNRAATIFTISHIRLNPDFFDAGGHNLLALSQSGAPGDTDLLVALQKVWMTGSGHYAVRIGESYFNVQDAYSRFTGNIATETAEANSKVTTQTVQVDQAQNMRMSIKGVSMDEEMAAMLRFQFAFQAASRVFNVIDSMIDRIVNGTGRVGM